MSPSPGAWILTSGLRFGITKHLGQAVRDHSLASTSSKVRVVAIGIAPWTKIHNREMLLNTKVVTSDSIGEYFYIHFTYLYFTVVGKRIIMIIFDFWSIVRN